MTENAGFIHGGASYPLEGEQTNTLLQDSDPSLFYALEFFSAMLETHLGARLVAEASAVGVAAPISSAVAYAVPFEPAPYLLSAQFGFPLLAVYRKTEKMTFATYNWRHSVTDFGVEYILPPLSAAQAERIVPILASVGRVLDNRTEQGWDPTYAPPGGASGDKVWSAAFAGLEEIGFVEASYGRYPGAGDMHFPAWTATLRVSERVSTKLDDFAALVGVDAAVDLAADGAATTTDFATFASDVTPPGPSTAGNT